MKRNLALLLTSVLLVFALTACGGDKKDNANPGNNTPLENGTDEGNTALPGNNDSIAPGGTGDGAGDLVPGDNDSLTGTTDGMTGTTDGNVSDSVTKQSGRIGVPYSQMLQNGRVHDTDGILTDRNHTVIPGSSY